MKKTTIYVDIEDDIAGIAEKLANAGEKIVALVLPKRPSVLQSSVNMRLLKKSAENASKNLVLITTDEQVVRLAGQSDVHVAKSLQSKPQIPAVEAEAEAVIEEISDEGAASNDQSGSDSDIDPAQPEVYNDEKKLDLHTPVGELTQTDSEDEIELDNTDPIEETDDKKPIKSKVKGIKVPNFGAFRNKLLLGGTGLVLLIAFLVWATIFAPRGRVTITTEKSDKQAKLSLTAGTGIAAVDLEQATIPATLKEDKQKLNATFQPTGQKDLGTKASGEVTLSIRCSDVDDDTPVVPAGTGISSGSLTFITNASVSLDEPRSGPCRFVGTTTVTAQNNGDQYNLSPRSYSVAGFSTVTATDSEGMSGGTSRIVKVVSQSDIDGAKQKAIDSGANDVKGKLSKLLSDEGSVAILDTFTSVNGEATTTVALDNEAAGDVTLTMEIVSTMFGIKKADADQFIAKEVEKEVTGLNQKIYDSGITKATIAVAERPDPQTLKISISSTATVGPDIDTEAVARELAGMKAGQAKQTLEQKNGIKQVEIRLSPFWVFSIPKNTSKTTVIVNE